MTLIINPFVMRMFTSICMCFGLLVCLSSCSLLYVKEQSDVLGELAKISGSVDMMNPKKKPAYVHLYRANGGMLELLNKQLIPENHHFTFDVLPGDYTLFAYMDENEDGVWSKNELVGYLAMEHAAPKVFQVSAKQRLNVGVLAVTGLIQNDLNIDVQNALTKTFKNIGRVVSLDNPIFSHENAAMGVWRPIDFIRQYGGGLMLLQDYESSKTPVIFVHGIFGSPVEFKAMIAKLDRKKFQPWVLYYPSGVSLDLVSDYLLKALNQLQLRYKFPRVNIIAHSMGGLMIRSFVMKHQQRASAFKLSLVTTINSPLYGLDILASGVKYSPIVIPVWKDLYSGSDYVKRVHDWHWPKDVPYHLIFSYLPGEDSDGVIPLKSQLSLSLQDEAIRIHGFQAEHTEILKKPEFIQRFNTILLNY